jgi:membrane-associated protease RseP (regulator of RpoE activity)
VTVVWQILAGLGFFALILVSVGLHELGHFLPSKLFGVKVDQFFIGFGPTLWKRRRGETEYGVKWLPLGGYCAIAGMLPPQREGKDTRLKRWADSIRQADWENISDQDVASGRLFYQQSLPHRLLIMAGGVGANLVLAFALFLGVNLVHGQPDPDDVSLTVHSVVACVNGSTGCVPTPAAAAGVQAGDTIVAVNGRAVATYDDYQQALEATVKADQAVQDLQLTVDRPAAGRLELPAAAGMMVTFDDGDIGPYAGVSLLLNRHPVGPVGTLREMGSMTWLSLKAIVRLPLLAWDTVSDLIAGRPRDPEGVMSVVGAARLAGQVAGTDQLGTDYKIALYLRLLGSINLFVAIFNLVPLLPFDGGHVAAGLYGGLRSWLARRRGRADPGPVDVAKLQPVAYIVGAGIVVLGVALVLADVLSPVQIF